MTDALDGLSVESLRALAEALERGLSVYTPGSVAPCVPPSEAPRTVAALGQFEALGMSPKQVAATLRLLARERAMRRTARDDIELVWTGPEAGAGQSRDTQVVVRELFDSAERSVLVASYCVYQWGQVFGPLASRMCARPGLSVRMFLHVDPPLSGETRAEAISKFARQVRERWPGSRLPEVFFDPRTLGSEGDARASLHAKCVVVDDVRVFVTSANFTEAAQQRNIEAGVLLSDATLASALKAQFENLVVSGALKSLPVE